MIVLFIILYLVGGFITFGILFVVSGFEYDAFFGVDDDDDKLIVALGMIGLFAGWPAIFVLLLFALIGRVLAKLALGMCVVLQIIFDRGKKEDADGTRRGKGQAYRVVKDRK